MNQPPRSQLVQLSLPGPSSLITVTVKDSFTVHDTIAAALSDSANDAALVAVFGLHYKRYDKPKEDVSQTGLWLKDAHGTPWALQTIWPPLQATEEQASRQASELLPLGLQILDHLCPLVATDSKALTRSSTPNPPSPRLRLVCGSPSLGLQLHFLHVAEIPDGHCRLWFLPAVFLDADSEDEGPVGSSAAELADAVIEELGLRKKIVQGTKTALIHYAICLPTASEAYQSGNLSSPLPSPLPASTSIPYLLQTLQAEGHNKDGYPSLIFTLDKNWLADQGTLARAYVRQVQPARTISRDSTLKANAAPTDPPNEVVSPSPKNDKNLVIARHGVGQKAPTQSSTTRLSRLFEGWGLSSGNVAFASASETERLDGSATLTGAAKIISVSAPSELYPMRDDMLSQSPVATTSSSAHSTASPIVEDDLVIRFENLVNDLGMKGPPREAMLQLPNDRKQFLVRQDEATKAAFSSHSSPTPGLKASLALMSETSKGEQGMVTSVSRALQNGWTNRLSIASWRGNAEESQQYTFAVESPPECREGNTTSGNGTPNQQVSSEITPQTTGSSIGSAKTGSLWSSWWGAVGWSADAQDSDAQGNDRESKRPEYYAAVLSQTDTRFGSRKDLVKHLIALRVTVASAKLSWIAAFVEPSGALDALDQLLVKESINLLVSQGRTMGRSPRADTWGKAVGRNDLGDVVIAESVKCLRALMNTEIGFEAVLARPSLTVSLAYSLRSESVKLRAQIADVMAALCVLSYEDGHSMVLSALSELKVVTGDRYRFDLLVNSLRVDAGTNCEFGSVALIRDGTDSEEGAPPSLSPGEAVALWELRVSAMVLVNALVNCPEELEDRIALREEFSRRGLNEALAGLRYLDPPDSLLTQLQTYSDEKQDDLEALARSQGNAFGGQASAFSSRLRDVGELLSALANEQPDLLPQMEAMIEHVAYTMGRDIDHQLKIDILYLLEKHLEHASDLEDFNDSWKVFIKAYLSSIQHLVGRQAMIISNRDSDTSSVPSSFVEELEGLRDQVERLSNDKAKLEANLNEQVARGNTLEILLDGEKVAPDSEVQSIIGGKDSFAGVIQRLIQKEKQVLSLQAELDSVTAPGRRADTGVGEEQRSKRERQERNRQWTKLMEEIARGKARINDLEFQLEQSRKEVLYLKRALEAVHGRLQSEALPEESKRRLASKDLKVASEEVDCTASMADNGALRPLKALADQEPDVAPLRLETFELQAQTFTEEERIKVNILMEEVKKGQEDNAKLQVEVCKLRELLSMAQIASPYNDAHGVVQPRRQAPKPPISTTNTSSPAKLEMPFPSSPPPPPPPPRPVSSVSVKISDTSQTVAPPAPPPPPPPPSVMAPISGGGVLSLAAAAFPVPPPPPCSARGATEIDSSVGLPPPPPPPPAPQHETRGIDRVATSAPPLPAPIPLKKRRALFWNKLANQTPQRSVWTDLATAPKVVVVVDELDELFALSTAKSKSEAVVTTAMRGSDKVSKVTTLLNHTRAQNVSIVLARVKLPLSEIRTAILQVGEDDDDDDVARTRLTTENLKALKQCLPTPDEFELYRKFDGDVYQLSRADQFFKEMLGIPRVQQRLTCMLYMRTFELDIEEVKPDLKALTEASTELKNCDKLKNILHTVLTIGNVLNSSTFRGAAIGFQLGDLHKLKDTKPANHSPGTPSLLHFLVRVLNKADKSLVGFLDECPHVEAAARLSTSAISNTVQTIISGYRMVIEEADFLRKDCASASQDGFLQAIQSFTEKNTLQIKGLQKASDSISRRLTGVVEYYGEDPGIVKAEEFFGLIYAFGQMLMRAEIDVLTFDKKIEVEQKKSAAKERAGPRAAIGPSLTSSRKASIPRRSKLNQLRQVDPFAAVEGASTKGNDRTPTGNKLPLLPPAGDTVALSSAEAASSSRFCSWGASAVACLTPVGEESLIGLSSAAGLPDPRKTWGRKRGHFEDAIKELRTGLSSTGIGRPGQGSRFMVRGESVVGFDDAPPYGHGHGRDSSGETIVPGGISGRKSLRVRESEGRFHQRPLSRIFLTGAD